MNDYDTLQDVFQRLEDLEPNSPRYNILSGKVYDQARYGPTHIPVDDLKHITTDLNQGNVDSAQNLVSDYLEPSEVQVE